MRAALLSPEPLPRPRFVVIVVSCLRVMLLIPFALRTRRDPKSGAVLMPLRTGLSSSGTSEKVQQQLG